MGPRVYEVPCLTSSKNACEEKLQVGVLMCFFKNFHFYNALRSATSSRIIKRKGKSDVT